MLSLARRRFPKVASRLVRMDLRSLGFQPASADVVRAQAVFHHLRPEEAQSAMAEVAQVLKPHGLLRVFVRYGAFEGFHDEPDLGPGYFHYYDEESLTLLLQRHGLACLRREVLTPPDPRRLAFLAVLASKEPRS